MNQQIITAALAVALIGAGSWYQGILSNRWLPPHSEKLTEFSNQLDKVPMAFGNWVGTDTPQNEKEFKASNCDRALSRQYRNATTGQVCDVYLVSGTARHVTIHLPDWCYVGAGYTMLNQPMPYTVDLANSETAGFLTSMFVKEEATGTLRLRILWGFTDSGKWEGPSWPERYYGGRPALYKVYLISNHGEAQKDLEMDDTVSFAKEFIPVVNAALFGSTMDNR
jgi:hypothetical protein